MVRHKQAAFWGLCLVLVLLVFKNGRTLDHYAGASTASRESSSSQYLAEEKLEDLAADENQTIRDLANTADNRSSTSSAIQPVVNQTEVDIPDVSTPDNRSSSTLSSTHPTANQMHPELGERNIYYYGKTAIVNKWYGWQPEIAASMNCSWRECFLDNHNCTTCRDSLEDLQVTNDSSIDPGPDWIPDVTMLARMRQQGIDAQGNPWPPPLLQRSKDHNHAQEDDVIGTWG